MCALPIQEREAAGMATETWWPFAWRVSTRGLRYGDSFVLGGPSSLTTWDWLVSLGLDCDFAYCVFALDWDVGNEVKMSYDGV